MTTVFIHLNRLSVERDAELHTDGRNIEDQWPRALTRADAFFRAHVSVWASGRTGSTATTFNTPASAGKPALAFAAGNTADRIDSAVRIAALRNT